MVAVGLLYAQGIQTLIIIMSLAVLYLAAVKFRRHAPLRIFLKLAGMYIMLDALKAPRALLNHQADSDSAKLAALTGLPELIWISLWMATALLCLVMAWKSEGRPEKRLK